MDALKPGLFFAYGSVDEDTEQGFNFGPDFDGHGAQMIGNEFNFGGDGAIGGATYVGAYCDFAASEVLSFTAQISYAIANADLNHQELDDDGEATGFATQEDDTAIDVSLTAAYKITDAVTYSLGGGYASISKDEGDDPDPGYKLIHKFNIAF
jgi:hypothetical protein